MSLNKKQEKICKICKSNNVIYFDAYESLHKTYEKFTYYECFWCGTIWLVDTNIDTSKYYESYYSFKAEETGRISKIKKYIEKKIITQMYMRQKGISLWKILEKVFLKNFKNTYFHVFDYIRALKKIDYKTKRLDFGCWNWESFLKKLLSIWFKNIYWVDPFIQDKLEEYIFKNTDDFKKEYFDVISLFHSLEHLTTPFETLSSLKDLLKQDWILIIELPIKSQYLWNIYKDDYYPLDPPRHVYLYSLTWLFKLFSELDLNILGFVWRSPKDYILESNLKKWISAIKKTEIKKTISYLDKINNSENYCFILQKI